MTAPENFVQRWARLKAESESTCKAIGEDDDREREAAALPDIGPPSWPHGSEEFAIEPFDPASLPSIEAITAGTDIRAFLQSQVSAELSRAALRQAWATDPAIRDFIGIAESQWDFNDLAAMPGFGPLRENDSVPALLEQALGRFEKLAKTVSEIPQSFVEVSAAGADHELGGCGQNAQQTSDMLQAVAADIGRWPDHGGGEGAAMKSDRAAEEDKSTRNRRSHGSALPR